LKKLGSSGIASTCPESSYIFGDIWSKLNYIMNSTSKTINGINPNKKDDLSNNAGLCHASSSSVNKKTEGALSSLCLTAALVSAPLNGLSPSLTLVSQEFGFDAQERDVYLGGYIALSTMVGTMIGSTISGALTDVCSRKVILVQSLIVAAFAMTLFGIIQVYPIMLALRAITGGCQGAIVPVLFSLIGDYYSVDDRATYSAIVSSCLGGGMMVGQLFTGYMLERIGWRYPFVIMGGASLLSALYVQMRLKEPVKGEKEDDLRDVLRKGVHLPPLTLSTFIDSITIPTVAVMMLQTFPSTIPWGILSAHLHDFLATDEKLSMHQATSMIAVFGAGAAFGGLFGGFIGGRLYSLSRSLLPMFMGVTMVTSALLLKELMTMDLDAQGVNSIAWPILVVSGALAAVNGANIRVVVLNLVTPQARGAAVAVLNFVNCAGRGMGPSLIDMWMQENGGGRKLGVPFFLNLWLVSGTMLCVASFTVSRDEERMRLGLKKFAEAAEGEIRMAMSREPSAVALVEIGGGRSMSMSMQRTVGTNS
jgi:MFS family permease